MTFGVEFEPAMTHTTSLWEEESFFAPTDILIVGSGLLGLWTAWELINKKPSAKITIIDRGVIPMGASTRNAGFACFGSPGEMLSDARSMGEDTMWSIVEMRYKGIQKIRQSFSDSEIQFDSSGGYECYTWSTIVMAELDDKLRWLNEGMRKITGVEQTFLRSDNKLQAYGLTGFEALVENDMEGGLHSGKLVAALEQKVEAAGVKILHGMSVKGWERKNGSLSVRTSLPTLHTQQLVLCTNGLSSQICADINIEPTRGQVLVTEPISNLKLKGTFHYDEGYYYFRNVGDRVLIGGARNFDLAAENSSDIVLNAIIHKELERFLSQHILSHQPYSISHQWSGIMGFSEDKLPVMKQIEDGVYAAVCCNGMGVALSPVIAERLCELVVGD